MGAEFSSGNALAIQCDRPFYCSGTASGDLVQGFVLLNCVAPFKCDEVRKGICILPCRMKAMCCRDRFPEGLKGFDRYYRCSKES